jgi:uncharacterized protein DUF955
MQRAWRLADEFALGLLRRNGVSVRSPVDVHQLAELAGVSISEAEIKQDGRFLPGPPPTILVKAGQPWARQRFTIAHELGHWAVAADGDRSASLREAFHSEEVLCNSVAAALLMPRPWILSTFPGAAEDRSLAMLQRVARAAGVSLSAAVIRLRDVFEWRKTLLHWSRVEGEWLFDGEAGVYPSEQGAIMPCSSATFTLNEVRNAGRGIQRCALPLRVFRSEEAIQAEVLPLRHGVAALIDAPGGRASRRKRRP